MVRIYTRIAALTVAYAASAANGLAASCPAPTFELSDFRAGDDARDRGFPGGISIIDADGDGDLDVFATQGYDTTQKKLIPRRSTLYLNDGRGRFSYAPDSDLTTTTSPASGSTWADVDRDGDLDAFVSTQLGQPDLFYRNQGGARFTREELGPVTTTKSSNFTSSWADIDGDGDLDLYVGGPTLEPPQPTLVYRNDNGSFVRVEGTPIENGPNNPGAVIWTDIDNDGDRDLLVANSDIARKSDYPATPIETAVIYRNDGGWSFTRMSGNAFEAATFPSIAAALGDVDNDGDQDLLLGLYENGKTKKRDRLFLNNGKGAFSEATGFVAPEHAEMATGAAFADFNLDGNLDLVLTSFGSAIAVFAGDGKAHFAPVADSTLAARATSHSAIATGDVNGDGKPDIVIGNWGDTSAGAYATLLINRGKPCGSWTEIVARDDAGAPNPPGTRVTLITRRADGTLRRQRREASAQTGFRALGASFFLFAVPAGEAIVTAEVRWPDGRTQGVTRLKTNARTEVTDKR